MRHRKLLPLHVSFNLDLDVHVVKQDELITPVSIRMHLFVHSDGVSHTCRQKCCEGQSFAGPALVLPHHLASPGHINFHQAMNNVSVTAHTPDRDHEMPRPREIYDLISIVTLFHLYL